MKILKYVLLSSLGLYLLIVAFLYFAQESFLFQPVSLDSGYQFEFSSTFKEVNLTMEDGAVLNALHFRVENPKGLILYYHGNAGNLKRWGEIVQYHVGLQYDVLIMDYRQYGKSTGDWTPTTFLSDAEAFYQFAMTQYNEEEIIVYGRSLGTGFASWVAARNTPRLLILESPYTSIGDMGNYFYPLVPSSWLIKYNFSPVRYLEDVQCPIRVFHGTNDFIVPYLIGKRLFEYHKSNKNIELITIEEGGHNDLIDYRKFKDEITSLLR